MNNKYKKISRLFLGTVIDLQDKPLKFPILKTWTSENYGLILLDSDSVTHYWDLDGTYDGWSIKIKI